MFISPNHFQLQDHKGHTLESVDTAKYLGVTIRWYSDLSWFVSDCTVPWSHHQMVTPRYLAVSTDSRVCPFQM